MRVTVCGGGGFIAGHLTRRLLDEGHAVWAYDIKRLNNWWQLHRAARNIVADLRSRANCLDACDGADWVFQLAARMGGIGEIESHVYDCSLNALINIQMLKAAEARGVKRFFLSSSACAYPAGKQDRPNLPALKESDVFPAMPEAGYGWSKLYSELICQYATAENRVDCRIARFHNSFGPMGSWCDGREKAPAAICRKVAEAKLSGNHVIDIWGDGTRTRSFMWIGDNIKGIRRIMDSGIRKPINLGSSDCVTINGLVSIVEDIAGVKLERKYDLSKPQGVYGRNSDNAMILRELNWEPKTPLREGLERTYEWIEEQVRKHANHIPRD